MELMIFRFCLAWECVPKQIISMTSIAIIIVFFTLCNLQQPLDEGPEAVGHIAERKVDAGGGAHDRTGVAESVETAFAVVGAHTRIANTTKGGTLVGNVHNGVVDARSARRGVTQYLSAIHL